MIVHSASAFLSVNDAILPFGLGEPEEEVQAETSTDFVRPSSNTDSVSGDTSIYDVILSFGLGEPEEVAQAETSTDITTPPATDTPGDESQSDSSPSGGGKGALGRTFNLPIFDFAFGVLSLIGLRISVVAVFAPSLRNK
jgi:hypothetical protein